MVSKVNRLQYYIRAIVFCQWPDILVATIDFRRRGAGRHPTRTESTVVSKTGTDAQGQPERPGKVTIVDLALAVGLDKSSVSRALGNNGKISAATRARVRQAALEMGYQPNVAARQLRKGAHLAIGLAIPVKVLDLYVVVKTIQELSLLALERQVILSIISCPSAEPGHFMPDGILAWGDIPFDDIHALCANGSPFVIIDPNNPSYLNRTGPRVCIDNAGGATAVTEHLMGRGAKRLLFVQAQENHIGHNERFKAARGAWLKKRPLHTITTCLFRELTDAHLKAFAAEPHGAIFCSNDQGAIEIWHRMTRLGLKTPADLELAGFDGDPYGELFGLTTAVVNVAKLAKESFDLLLALMDRKATESSRIVPVELRAGQTS